MISLKLALRSAVFSSFHKMNLHSICGASLSGLGVIFMMHRVLPSSTHKAFSPNKYLAITPDFLEETIDLVRALGVEIVSLDKAYQYIMTQNKQRFAVFTFDDGFKDVLENAYPVFKRKEAPFTLYIPSAWPGGDGFLYWSLLERIIAVNDEIFNTAPAFSPIIKCKTLAEKQRCFHQLSDYFSQKKDPSQDPDLRKLLESYSNNHRDYCRREIMDWEEIRTLGQDDLVTIGAHSVNHSIFQKLTNTELAFELNHAKEKIEDELQRPCQHLAYPFGDKLAIQKREIEAAAKAGYKTATTTRKGVIQPEHKENLMALPRVHLHGDYQSKGYISMVLSGLPFFILNRFRRHIAD
jgi:peptidoglycan/xylan/chitin deacetylase (PgdA/CDA1 family)